MSKSRIIFEDMVIEYSPLIDKDQLKRMLTAVLNTIDRMPAPEIPMPKTSVIIPTGH